MIQFATETMWPALQTIWAACFGDTGSYLEQLFRRLLRPEHILVDTVDGKPVAMLCIEPATLTTPVGSAEAAYIYGVATLPKHRGEGRSSSLLEECHRRLAEDGFALSVLVPAEEGLFRFYGKRGYETAFDISMLDLPGFELPSAAKRCVLTPASLSEFAAVRDEIYADRAMFVRWSRDYLSYIGDECAFLGGEVLRILCGGETGYAVCYPMGNRVVVKELAARDAYLGDVMAAVHARYRADRYRFYLPADTPEAANKVLPFAMVRWYDKEKQNALAQVQGRAAWIAHVLD